MGPRGVGPARLFLFLERVPREVDGEARCRYEDICGSLELILAKVLTDNLPFLQVTRPAYDGRQPTTERDLRHAVEERSDTNKSREAFALEAKPYGRTNTPIARDSFLGKPRQEDTREDADLVVSGLLTPNGKLPSSQRGLKPVPFVALGHPGYPIRDEPTASLSRCEGDGPDDRRFSLLGIAGDGVLNLLPC